MWPILIATRCREHPGLTPTDEQAWDIVRRRAYYFVVDDLQYAGVRIGYFL
jgi:hypothetical protein